jgi:hypothetical protein
MARSLASATAAAVTGFGERGEAAVGGEPDALGPQQRDGPPGAGQDIGDGLDARVLLIHNAHAEAEGGRQVLQHRRVARSRRAQLEEERAGAAGASSTTRPARSAMMRSA